MPEAGPGKFGGSRATVRKRAQRKRAAAQGNPVRKQDKEATVPVIDAMADETKMANMAYELVSISTQLKKLLNKHSDSFSGSNSIVQDMSRAEKIIRGAMKDNTSKENYKKEI